MESDPRSPAERAASYSLLSEEERWNILRNQLLARYPPRENDPAFPINPTIGSSTRSDSSQSQVTDRIGTTNWCSCQNCIAMPTNVEAVCCQELEEVKEYIPPGKICITEVEIFNTVVASDRLIPIINNIVFYDERPEVDPDNNRRLRKIAYRTYISCIYGFLGKGNRRVIPSCAVNIIRLLFPDPNGRYVGFMYSEDYNASEMAYH
ncbi:P2X purinoceptor 7-like [Rana temporaria]|uniref:P2X purinoceptor 7-like n=1 Tax=Rana temporaria TaxID=8407 RepID=UPI001AAC7451|nr:P2X purinoceptor 7-like [Rana temporaria]